MRAVDEEILLLRSKRRVDAVDALIAEQLEQLDRFLGERVGATQERRHFVERLAVVAHEDAWDAQRLDAGPLGDEHRARGIPRRVAARLPRRAESAAREARGVGLALNQ